MIFNFLITYISDTYLPTTERVAINHFLFFFEHMLSKDLMFCRIEKFVYSLFPFGFYSCWGFVSFTVGKEYNVSCLR